MVAENSQSKRGMLSTPEFRPRFVTVPDLSAKGGARRKVQVSSAWLSQLGTELKRKETVQANPRREQLGLGRLGKDVSGVLDHVSYSCLGTT
jgi:hypothetical protein